MGWVPKHQIYQSDGTTLIRNIANVIRREPAIDFKVPDFIEHTSLRGTGSIIVPGGNKAYDMTFYCYLKTASYTALMSALALLESQIAVNTHYVLKIDTSSSTTQNLNVMRLQPIIVDSRGNLNTYCFYTLTLKVNSW